MWKGEFAGGLNIGSLRFHNDELVQASREALDGG